MTLYTKIIGKIIGLIIVLSFLFVESNVSFGQTNSKPIKNHIEKALALKDTDVESSFLELDTALELATQINDDELLADIYYSTAKVFDACQKYDSAVIYYEFAAPIFRKVEDSLNAAKCYINIGATEYYFGNYQKALETYDIASIFLKNLGETDLESKVYNNLALINKSLGHYKIAIENFQKVLEIHDLNKNEAGKANTYLNIGTIYWEYRNLQSALKSFNFALDIYQILDMQKDVGSVYNNIGLVYSDLDSLDIAMNYYNDALEINANIDDNYGVAISLLNKAALYDKLAEVDMAEELFLESLVMFEELSYHLGIFVCKLNLSRIYSESEQHNRAINLVLEAFGIKGIDQPIKYLSDGYLTLAEGYSDLNNYEDANLYYRKYFIIQDSIFSININNQILELQSKYEIEKAETRIAMYEQTVEIQNLEIETNKRKIRNTTIILLLSLVFALTFIVLYIQKQRTYLSLVKQNVQIAKADIEKEKQMISSDADKQASNLSDDQKQDLYNKLISLMEKDKYFMQKQITINDIAKKLNTNRNYLSQLINDFFNANFNSFLNEFRVKEARKLLLIYEYRNYTIEGIGETVGFHSKATFNTAFKKITGVTPSFFKNNSSKI